MSTPKNTYLGDGVYANNDGYHIVLTTGHHDPEKADNTICLDSSVVSALISYVEKTWDMKITVGKAES